MFKKITLLSLLIQTIAFGQLDFSEKNRLDHPLFKEMEKKIKAGDYEDITSVVVAQNGKVIFENYYNGADVNSKHNTRSATKTMATYLTGIAIDQGFIASEKDPIFKYLKDRFPVKNPDPRKREMTIEDLLSMSSLMECDDNNSFSRGNEEKMYIVEDWLGFFLNLPIKSFPYSPKPEDSPYGRSMSYCSAGSAAMAEVVQAAVGVPAHKFLEENLLKPLDITDYKLHLTPKGTLNTAGGSEYRSRDFLKIIQTCLNGGQWNGKQIMSADWIKKATTPKANAWEGMDYGYLFWLREYGENESATGFAMAGNGGNKVMAFPELNLTVVLTATNYNNRKAHGYTDELLHKFIIPAARK